MNNTDANRDQPALCNHFSIVSTATWYCCHNSMADFLAFHNLSTWFSRCSKLSRMTAVKKWKFKNVTIGFWTTPIIFFDAMKSTGLQNRRLCSNINSFSSNKLSLPRKLVKKNLLKAMSRLFVSPAFPNNATQHQEPGPFPPSCSRLCMQ